MTGNATDEKSYGSQLILAVERLMRTELLSTSMYAHS